MPPRQPPASRIGPRLLASLSAVTLLVAGCGGEGASAGEGIPATRPHPGEDVPDGPTTVPPSPLVTTAPDGEEVVPGPTVPPEVRLPLLATTTTTFLDRTVDPPPPVADPGGPPGRNSVMIVGDSVLMGTARDIPLVMSHWLVTYDAIESRRLAQAVELLEARRHEIGEAVVIHLGNNYIPGERGDYASQIDEVMSLLWFVPRVVWVTVAEVNPGRDEINRSIREAGERWPNMRVADWAPVVAANPSFAWDGLHLSFDGRRALAQLVAQTVGPVDRP